MDVTDTSKRQPATEEALLGIDVGGTHTDAVLIDSKGVAAEAKIPTNPADLMSSLKAVLQEVLQGRSPGDISRFSLSTTLCTNAIVQHKTDPVGVLVSAGAGLDPAQFALGEHFVRLDGALDHRGAEILAMDRSQVKERIQGLAGAGVRVFAVVGKFSPRNPGHEKLMEQELLGRGCDYVTLGHTLSGQLNFPRRIATAYYNSAVWRIYNGFADAVHGALDGMGLSAPVHVLKADGGTMLLEQSRSRPVETILSGPAASVMGLVALCDIRGDAVLLDIGGTTTDIAVFASGAPILDRQGTAIRERATLVRALHTQSIGIGGDSAVQVADGTLAVGPQRHGECLAKGGPVPTLVDALNVLGHCRHGRTEDSWNGMHGLGERLGIAPEEAARRVLDQAVSTIRQAVGAMLDAINNRPVYTVYEVLEERRISPERIYLMGGPAEAMSAPLSRDMGLESVVPGHAAVANAVGAALARPTMLVELFADTSAGVVRIPSLGISRQIRDSYSLEDAREEVQQALTRHMQEQGLEVGPVEIVEQSAMNMVRDFHTTGQDIRVRCQIKPGVSKEQGVLQCPC